MPAGAKPQLHKEAISSSCGSLSGFPAVGLFIALRVRVLLRFGADPSRKCRSHFGGDLVERPEEEALRQADELSL